MRLSLKSKYEVPISNFTSSKLQYICVSSSATSNRDKSNGVPVSGIGTGKLVLSGVRELHERAIE
jgi:hypothetical protein